MLSRTGRPFVQTVFGPIAKLFVKMGVSADAVTLAGAVLGVALSLTLLPTNHLVVGSLSLGGLALFDSIDGQIARLTNTSSKWGAFLDSTLDRITDVAIFSGLLAWAYLHGESGAMRTFLMIGLLAAMGTGSVVPYARARAEGLGMTASVGIAASRSRFHGSAAPPPLRVTLGTGQPKLRSMWSARSRSTRMRTALPAMRGSTP